MDKIEENNTSTEELIKRKEIDNTPFTIITTEEGSFGVMGVYRLTDPMKDEWEVEKELKKMTWNRITQVVLLLIETMKENKSNKKKNNTKKTTKK